MGLQKLVPTCGLAAKWSGIQSMALADVVDGRIAHLESQIGQRTHDALAAPGWVFLEQCDNEFFQFRIHGRSTDRISPGKGPLFGDQDTKPTEGIWSDECGQFPKAAPAEELGFARQPDALNVGEALGFATELFQENAILFLEVIDDSLLVSAHPAGDSDQEELELRRHRVENLSEVPSAQSSIWSRLSFLVVQDLKTFQRIDFQTHYANAGEPGGTDCQGIRRDRRVSSGLSPGIEASRKRRGVLRRGE